MWGSTQQEKSEIVEKYPYKRVEPMIQRFISVCTIDLDRIKQHKTNIYMLQCAQDWKGLNKEQINATRTIQQVKATLRELEQTRSKIKDDDLEKFDLKVMDMYQAASDALKDFVQPVMPEGSRSEEQESRSKEDKPDLSSRQPIATHAKESSTYSTSIPDPKSSRSQHYDNIYDPPMSLPASMTQSQIVVPSIAREEELLYEQHQAEASMSNLCSNIEELNGLMHAFAQQVTVQGEKVDSIEDNIEQAQVHIEKGTSLLQEAAKWKSAIYPMAGALLGAAVGGPVGLLAGLKIGAATAVGGGITGFTVGKVAKKLGTYHIDDHEKTEMMPLKKSRSKSLPDIK